MSESHRAEPGHRLYVLLSIDDRETLRTLLRCVREDDGGASTVQILETDHTEEVPIFDISRLTDKQWEALRLAYERGYYQQDRDTDLEALATELGITKSAVSQRLQSAETKLVIAVMELGSSMRQS